MTLDPRGGNAPDMASEDTRQDIVIETQMDRRLRSTIARDEDKNVSSAMHKETSRNGIKVNRMEDNANMTGTAFANKENF